MSDPGGQESDAHQPFASDELFTPLVHLTGQVLVDIPKANGHRIEFVRQFLKFVFAPESNRQVEVAAMDPLHAGLQFSDRGEYPDAEVVKVGEHHHDGKHRGCPAR